MKMDLTMIPIGHFSERHPQSWYTKPFGHIEHNGLNFRYSVSNKKSRLHKMLNYLHTNSDKFVSRREIISQVFGKTIVKNPWFNMDVRGGIGRSWGSYLFSLSIKCGFVRTIRKGNSVYYIITEKGKEVIGV